MLWLLTFASSAWAAAAPLGGAAASALSAAGVEAPPAAAPAAPSELREVDSGGVWLLSARVQAARGVPAWQRRLGHRANKLIEADRLGSTGLTECAEIRERAAIVVCHSFFQADLNAIFGRASIYAEGGYELPTGSLARQDDPDNRKLNLTVDGHDLKSRDLRAFFAKALEACRRGDRERCLNAHEEQFYRNVFLPESAKYGDRDFVVLGFSYQTFGAYQETVGHEIMHAQYFLDPRYHEAVAAFWNGTLSPQERAAVRGMLDRAGYDPKNEELMMNEFQAYVLEPGARKDRLKRYAARYGEALARALAAAGDAPIQVR